MQNKKVILLIILGVLAVISLIRGITAQPGNGRRASSKSAAVQGNKANLDENILLTKRLATQTQFKSWRRRLFAPFGTASSSSSLVVSGIIWSKDRPKAMIGDTIVAKGDTIGGNKVVDIKPDKVILNDGVKDFELKIEK